MADRIHLGLRITLNELYDRYQKPLFIVENGLGAVDTPDENGNINDQYSDQYLSADIQAMEDAVELDWRRPDGIHAMGMHRFGICRYRRDEETLWIYLC